MDDKDVALSVATPFIALPAGSHRLTVTYNGHSHWEQSLAVEPTRLLDVVAEPDETLQRKLAYASIGTAGVTAAAAIVLGVFSVIEFRRSREVLFDEGFGTLEAVDRYREAVSAADDFRVGSGTAGGVALGLFVVGATLFAFDDPSEPSAGNAENARRVWLRLGF